MISIMNFMLEAMTTPESKMPETMRRDLNIMIF